LPAHRSNLFDADETNPFYYIVWLRDGSELSRSTTARADASIPESQRNTSSPGARTRGALRELFLFTRPGECVLVGRSIGPELRGQRELAYWMTGLGGGVLALGLAGGWWLANRAIRPINEISATSARIAAGDLSQRISSTETESEFGRLTSVLNSTFARLEAAFAQQGQFTADASHELRTPVSVILSQAQSALARERSPAEYRDSLQACQRAAQRMRQLIESLLDLARLDAGEETMHRAQFDLSSAARECVELIRPLPAERGIQIHTDLASVLCEGDEQRIVQVITNLLTNAIHFTGENGQVHVSTRSENGTALLLVSDTGDGIPAEDLPHVFERFYRVDKSRSGIQGRTGLGLAICKAIVNAHNGSIDVQSEPGKGTTFLLRLPGK
jgi:heavy metal sensor kinase